MKKTKKLLCLNLAVVISILSLPSSVNAIAYDYSSVTGSSDITGVSCQSEIISVTANDMFLLTYSGNLTSELKSGGIIKSRRIVEKNSEYVIVESIIDMPAVMNSVNGKSTAYGTATRSKVHEIYINGNYLVAKATLTASFEYNEASDYVKCTSKSKNMYVTSGSSSYFNNVSLTETSGGGGIIKKYVTAKLSYGYGIAGATNTLSIKCKSDGTIT